MKTNTLRSLLIFLLIIAGSTQTIKAQVLLYDNFNYPAGDSLIWHNWLTQQTNVTNAILVANEGLSYAGYPCSGIGNAAAVGTTGQDVFRGFVKQTLSGTNLYMALLAKVTMGATGDAFITFKESPTSPTNLNYRGRVYAKVDGSNNLAFGISKGAITAPASANYSAFNYSLNTTYLLVVKYKIIEGTTNDSAFLFINPVIGSSEPAPSVTATDITASDLGLGSVMLRQGNTGSSPTVIVDGVRVAKTWQNVLSISNIATLSNIKVDALTVSGFDPETTTYNDTVPTAQPTVTVTATTTDWAANAVINTAASVPGVSTIIVTAEDGTTTKTYTVNHAYAYYTVSTSVLPGSAGSVTGAGIYGQGFSATLTATPATDYIFLNWTEGGNVVSSSSTYIFNVAGDRTLVANFVPASFQVTATSVPIDGGTVFGAGAIPYGTNATLTANPATGFSFAQWTEGATVLGSNPQLVIANVTANHDVVAQFQVQVFNITASANPTEGGVVTGSTAVSYGSSATVSAAANAGYIFENWTENGTVLGTSPELTITNITANHNIIGNFVQSVNTYTVSASANPPQGGTITGSGNVTQGGNITLQAIANPDYVFLYWTENGTNLGTNPEITISNVSANHNLIANFLSTVSIPENECNQVNIFPTVTTDFFKVQSSLEMKEITVYNLVGQIIFSLKSSSKEVQLNAGSWRNGAYLFKILTAQGVVTRKVYVK